MSGERVFIRRIRTFMFFSGSKSEDLLPVSSSFSQAKWVHMQCAAVSTKRALRSDPAQRLSSRMRTKAIQGLFIDVRGRDDKVDKVLQSAARVTGKQKRKDGGGMRTRTLFAL